MFVFVFLSCRVHRVVCCEPCATSSDEPCAARHVLRAMCKIRVPCASRHVLRAVCCEPCAASSDAPCATRRVLRVMCCVPCATLSVVSSVNHVSLVNYNPYDVHVSPQNSDAKTIKRLRKCFNLSKLLPL